MKFLGMPYPIRKTVKGYLSTQSGINQIKSDLLCLLLTNPGERVMLPEFGTPLRKLIFEPNDEILKQQARKIIIDSISIWEPRITVVELNINTLRELNSTIEYDTEEEVDKSLYISIKFIDPEQIKEIQELKLNIPLGNE